MKNMLILLSFFAFLIALNGNGMATIVNGGFETGDFTGWDTWVSSTYPVELSITTDAQDGYYAAKGSMTQSCENGSIEQTFIVPEEGIFLFYYKSNMSGGIIYDDYRILSGWSLFDITTEAQITSEYFNDIRDYTLAIYDLSAYAGHNVKFRVFVGSDGSCGTPIDPSYEVHIDDVRVVTIDNQVPGNHGSKLVDRLEAAKKTLERGNIRAGCNQVLAIINQVEAFISSGVLTEEEGQFFIDAANSLISQYCE